MDFFDDSDIFYQHQFDFREKHSTQQAIISLVEKITGAWELGDIVIEVFLDLKKAFDTVPHDILPKKNALKLLKSYFTDRQVFSWHSQSVIRSTSILAVQLRPFLIEVRLSANFLQLYYVLHTVCVYRSHVKNVCNFLGRFIYLYKINILLKKMFFQ